MKSIQQLLDDAIALKCRQIQINKSVYRITDETVGVISAYIKEKGVEGKLYDAGTDGMGNDFLIINLTYKISWWRRFVDEVKEFIKWSFEA